LIIGDQNEESEKAKSDFRILTLQINEKGLYLDTKKIEENFFISDLNKVRDNKKLCFYVIVQSDIKIDKYLSFLKSIEEKSDGRWLLNVRHKILDNSQHN